MVGYFHVCTHGGKLPWMFQDDEDFIMGINRVAICKHLTDVKVLNFILMDNHIHLLIHSDFLSCKTFINKFKLMYGKWVNHKYGTISHLKHLSTEIIRINNMNQLLKVIAYIDRNSIKAGFNSLPTYYPWGGAKYLFSKGYEKEFNHKVSDLSRNEQIIRLRTKNKLPQDWLVDGNFMINPCCFLDTNATHSLIQTPNKYIYHLSQKIEGEIEQMYSHTDNTFIPDKELRVIISKILADQFGVDSVKFLNAKDRMLIAKTLRYEYGSTLKQISRLLSVNLEALKNFV